VVLINPLMVFTWGLMYLMGYFVIRRDIHVASMTATIATVVLVFSFPERVIRLTTIVTLYEAIQLRLYVAAIGFLIFLRHVEPIREFLVREHDTE